MKASCGYPAMEKILELLGVRALDLNSACWEVLCKDCALAYNSHPKEDALCDY